MVKAQIHAEARSARRRKVGGCGEALELAKKILGYPDHSPDGPKGAAVQRLLTEDTCRSSANASRNRARPRAGQAGSHGVRGGRYGYRRSRREDAGADSEGDARISGPRLIRLGSWPSASGPAASVKARPCRDDRALQGPWATDASLAEINPHPTKDGKVSRSTPKSRLTTTRSSHKDLSGTARPERKKIRSRSKPAARAERTSSSHGTVGCMVNGAGLAMADHGYHPPAEVRRTS